MFKFFTFLFVATAIVWAQDTPPDGEFPSSEYSSSTTTTMTVPTTTKTMTDDSPDDNDSPDTPNTSRVVCLNDTDCGSNGKCPSSEDTTRYCKCDDGYLTTSQDDPCGYKQRSKYISMVLSGVVGFSGANWFYMSRGDTEYIGFGVIFLVVFMIALSLLCCGGSSSCLRGLGIALMASIFAGMIVVLILVGLDELDDGDDHPMVSDW